MAFTPDAAPYNACDNITVGSNTVSFQDYAHDEIVNKVSELDDQTTAQAESIAKNVQDIATNAENIATNTADITELKSNNYLVEIKDTVTENTNYETHDVKETSSDGTENQVSNFVLAAKQITGISVDADAASMTINTVNQTGAAESETLTLPAGGGTTYDDTQVKADIATNTANIATNTANIATNTANIVTNTSDIEELKNKTASMLIPDYENRITDIESGTSWTATENCYMCFFVNNTSQSLVINGVEVLVGDASMWSFNGFLKKGDTVTCDGNYINNSKYSKIYKLRSM